MDDKELKPCPFCGGEGHSVYAPCDYNRWGVYCTQCGNTIEVDNGYGSCPDTEEAAIQRWNTRPIEDALQKENSEFKGQLKEIEKYFESTGDGCQFCKHLPCVVGGKSKFKQGGCHFEWRGTKEAEDGTKVD